MQQRGGGGEARAFNWSDGAEVFFSFFVFCFWCLRMPIGVTLSQYRGQVGGVGG